MDDLPVKVVRIGLDDLYTESAPYEELLDRYSLSAEHIAKMVAKAIIEK